MVTRAPEQTRARILQAGEAVLLEDGPGKLRIDSVARTAHANKRMIYHYFGDKQGLLDAVYAIQAMRVLRENNGLHTDTREVLAALFGGSAAAVEESVESVSAQELCRAARILIPMLLERDLSVLDVSVSARQWQRFAFEMLSLALAEVAGGVLNAQPGSAQFAEVSERLLTSPKPRFRISSASRSRE